MGLVPGRPVGWQESMSYLTGKKSKAGMSSGVELLGKMLHYERKLENC